MSLKLRSVIPWTGGKHPLRGKLMEHIPKEFETYFEPFSGAASLLLMLQPKKARINDINPWIVLIYYFIKVQPNEFMKQLEKLDEVEDDLIEAKYKNMVVLFNNNQRKLIKDIPHSLESIQPLLLKKLLLPVAQFYFICKFSYGGHIWVDDKGEYNSFTHMSKITGRHLYNEKLILDVSKYLQNDVKFYHGDYSLILKGAKKGDFIYMDPPYFNSDTENNIAKYSTSAFDYKEQKQLANRYRQLSAKGCFLLESNTCHVKLTELYKEFKIVRVKVQRLLYVRENEDKNNCFEVLIKNY